MCNPLTHDMWKWSGQGERRKGVDEEIRRRKQCGMDKEGREIG